MPPKILFNSSLFLFLFYNRNPASRFQFRHPALFHTDAPREAFSVFVKEYCQMPEFSKILCRNAADFCNPILVSVNDQSAARLYFSHDRIHFDKITKVFKAYKSRLTECYEKSFFSKCRHITSCSFHCCMVDHNLSPFL